MRVEEEGVHAPGERLDALIQVFVFGNRGKLSSICFPYVFFMRSMLVLNVTNPESRKDGLLRFSENR